MIAAHAARGSFAQVSAGCRPQRDSAHARPVNVESIAATSRTYKP